MHITAIKTPKIVLGDKTIFEVIDEALPTIEEGSIIAVTSKIISICEGNVVSKDTITKEELIVAESDLYLPAMLSKYGHHFTITRNMLISSAGIDESNGEGYYILWPKDAQKTANEIRKHLSAKHGIQNVGVVITDSTCQPLRRGIYGIFLAHSGFKALRDYIGKPDLFGRPMTVTQSNIAGGLAAAAVLAMGEGAEQTPLCLMTDLSSISFQSRDPSEDELDEITISLDDDLFAPFLTAVEWKQGGNRRAL
ncbi:MAG TPA: coenzyme F420-0:L-glutamate ligase [Candidatus Saccharimonadales bacterium]|nr:coenzyme F420-0:L-glutamate ligase [Candidatus Saccharimonadales bacterium]